MLFAFGHSLRLARAAFLLAREGVFADVDPAGMPPPARLPIILARFVNRRGEGRGVERIAGAIARLGPSYVKLGQFLATRPDVVGAQVAQALEALQDRMAPFPRDIAVAAVESAFGRPLGEVFTEFGEPVAAASIAQVHRARAIYAEGEREVAVKILRPGIERRFRRDLSDMYFAARFAESYFAEARRLKLIEVVDTLARSVRMEMDFRLEAAAASEFGETTAEDADFHVPRVDWDRTAREVLTLEWIEGIPLSDIPRLVAAGHDLPALGRAVLQSFLRQAVRDGFFHADMHQGNLFADRDGRLVAVDFGIMGRLGAKERRFLAEILYGFITRDYLRVAEVHYEAGYVPPIHPVENFAQALRAIGEPIHSRTADQISMAKLLTLLFEITGLFHMRTRTELVMLQKTMVVVEGVARSLDPKLDIWSTAEPVVRTWIEQNLGPGGFIKDAGRGLNILRRVAANLPDSLERAEHLLAKIDDLAEHGFHISLQSIEAIGAAEARRAFWGHIAWWIIAAVLVWWAVF
ncbi:MAG: 2-polyprenylphenol 6-hydroxylase [Beijerinckiaceae bacterium]